MMLHDVGVYVISRSLATMHGSHTSMTRAGLVVNLSPTIYIEPVASITERYTARSHSSFHLSRLRV
jgi:hypothetical protein